MHFGADYHPEHWVFPYAGEEQDPEARWRRDAELMVAAGMTVVRMGEFSWGLYEREEGHFDFGWMQRAVAVMGQAGLKVLMATPTAAPPVWLARKHPEILPVTSAGLVRHEGTRRAVCMNSNIYWEYSKRIVTELARAMAGSPSVIGWQIDNGVGAHDSEAAFNEETRRDWVAWLRQKYETVERLNELLGLRFWGQVVGAFEDVPMPMDAPAPHNPALILDWRRFCSDTLVAFVRMQAEILHEITPHAPVTHNLRPMTRLFDHFDLAGALDFVGMESSANIKAKSAENACGLDLMRSLKKDGIRTPDGEPGFWLVEQKAGHVSYQDVNSLVRPGVVRLFTYQCLSRGATGMMYFYWRQPRFGSEKFYGGVLSHDGRGENRVYREIAQIGEEMKLLRPAIKGTRVEAEVCVVVSHENEWSQMLPPQPNEYFKQSDHVQLFYNALHDRNIAVDFARPTEDLSRYKLVIAPSMQLMAGGEADLLKLYVHNGGTLVGTFNTGLVDEHHIAPDSGYPHDLTDLFGLEVLEFDPLPAGEENHLAFRGAFPATHLHPARMWCDLIETRECEVLATYTKDFYAGRAAMTLHTFGLGKAIYLGTLSHPAFYLDLATWLRQLCGLTVPLKVPEGVEVSVRQNAHSRIYFVLNHLHTAVRVPLFSPMHDFLTGSTLSGHVDLQPLGVLVLDESLRAPAAGPAAE